MADLSIILKVAHWCSHGGGMWDDENRFLSAIHSAPGDDAPRLVYADWLDEHGRDAEAARIRDVAASRRHDVDIVDRGMDTTAVDGGRGVEHRREYTVMPHRQAPDLSPADVSPVALSFAPPSWGQMKFAYVRTTRLAGRMWSATVVYRIGGDDAR